MKTLKLLIFALMFAPGLQASAAIDCRPGMGGGCPEAPGPNPALPIEEEELIEGYAQVSSPTCDPADFLKAQKLAELRADGNAAYEWGANAVRVSDYKYSTRCGQSPYVGSQGNYWMVLALAQYQVK